MLRNLDNKASTFDVFAALPPAWRLALLKLAIAVSILALITHEALYAMVYQWWNVESYNHILIVPVIIGWLLYRRWGELRELQPAIWWGGVPLLVAAMALWLIGDAGHINTISQLGTLAAVIALIVTIMGPHIALACAFPIAFGVFLVPVGTELEPAMQVVTTDIVTFLSKLTATPAVIDGVFIQTPAGLFEVAPGCSGVRFLTAMCTLGVFIAYVCYTKWVARISFVAGALVFAIATNGFRAWGTVYLAQFFGIEFAAGFDHILYGWIFFAIILAAMLALCWRSFDRDPDDLGIDFANLVSRVQNVQGGKDNTQSLGITACIASILAVFTIWAMMISQMKAPEIDQISLTPPPGWTAIADSSSVAWEPIMQGADNRILNHYVNAQGDVVDVALGYYRGQSEEGEAGGVGQGALIKDSPWRWVAAWDTNAFRAGEIILAYGRVKRFAITSYRHGATLTASASRLKLGVLSSNLRLTAQPVQTLIISTEAQSETDARRILSDFEKALGDKSAWIDRSIALKQR